MKQKNQRIMVSTKNKQGKIFSIPTKQRALILQGGGALGYYEIGVLQSLCDHLFKRLSTQEVRSELHEPQRGSVTENDVYTDGNNKKYYEEQYFDIVAGVSIGAINAVFLVDYVLKNNGNWIDCANKLKSFWNNFEANTIADGPMFQIMWNNYRMFNPLIASTESARRYWSFYQLTCNPYPMGSSPNLCYSVYQYDDRFLSPLNAFYLYNYKPLKQLMSSSINYPIKTDVEKNQPRLLLLSVDVMDCSSPVLFDSYRSYKRSCDVCGKDLKQNRLLANHIREHLCEIARKKDVDNEILEKSVSGNSITDEQESNSVWMTIYGDEERDDQKHVVVHNGIDNDILMTSCLFPYSSNHTKLYDLCSKGIRTFWDGAFLSNTPLREVIQKHKDFWSDYFTANDIEYDKFGEHEKEIYENHKNGKIPTSPKIPDLEIFIVNLYPAVETIDSGLPRGKDKIEDRINDIRFHDRSKYDEKVAHLITDYIDLTRELIKLATEKGKVSKEEIENLLKTTGESTKRDVKQKRTWTQLVEDKFRVKVYRIDREDDKDTIFGKASDFTPTTLAKLYDDGLKDADKWFKEYYEEWEINV
ncbi:putative Patatin-like phospholipase [Candidatus Nitrosocosmicus franklandus]|uniref:Putative Patatin-like phospholipase n=2 Tax=Candidatus Nitrosocosmicus franklandianus TaxID=1798806 RepID=A0A484IF56_9ARCH|nr:putative Patatin-like phospholipase [Candidatus Nitrosocosmicus franklandus]